MLIKREVIGSFSRDRLYSKAAAPKKQHGALADVRELTPVLSRHFFYSKNDSTPLIAVFEDETGYTSSILTGEVIGYRPRTEFVIC
jgi:hypothetical protein